MLKNKAEIEEMIAKLDQLSDKLPQKSLLGTNNWETINVQREVLEWVLGEGDPPVADEDLE